VGSYLKSDLPNARYALNNSVVINKGSAIYFHPISDSVMEKIGKKGKTTEFIQYEPLKEEYVLYFILDKFGKDLPENIQEYLNSLKETRVKTVTETVKETVVETVKDEESGEEKEVKKVVSKKVPKEVEFEYTKLLDEIGADEKLLDTLEALLAKKDKFSLMVGEDLYTHPKSENLGKLCGLIDKYTDFDIVIIPSQTNTLGVSLICDITDEHSGFCVGYNEKADFQLSALGDGDLDMPALNQQEGTFTNVDKKVIPTNVAIGYKGYVLNDIANAVLEDDIEYTIEYTQKLPLDAGFKEIEFDKLPNYFGNDRVEYRGYDISSKSSDVITEAEPASLEKIELLENETLIYRANPINQFNEFTAIAHEFAKDLESGLFASKELFEKLGLEKGNKVKVFSKELELKLNAYCDEQIAGEVAYISTFQKDLDTKALFDEYRFSKAVIKKA
jgi:NADH-quinone oxidoreductase subunit G